MVTYYIINKVTTQALNNTVYLDFNEADKDSVNYIDKGIPAMVVSKFTKGITLSCEAYLKEHFKAVTFDVTLADTEESK